MADPGLVQSAGGTSTTASTAVTFTAATAGNLLLLATAADDYRTGTPSGWTQVMAEVQTYHGLNFWYKIAAGGETSVTYVIGSGTRSAWKFAEFSNVSAFGSGSGTFTQASGATQATPTHTPTAGRKLIVAVAGFSTASTALAFTDITWASVALTHEAPSIGPLSNPQESVGLGWQVADFTGSNTVASTATVANQAAQARSAAIASFAVAASGNAGTLSAPVPTATATISGASTNPGTMSASTPTASSSSTGASTNPGTMAASAPRASSSSTGASTNPGTMAASAPRATT
ncbi:hypothetical protein, partial [Tessaracoccus sp.]